MAGLVLCIILLIIIGARDTEAIKQGLNKAHQLYDNTDMWREQELFHYLIYNRKRLDGTSIPKDFTRVAIWNEVDKQLKKEGLRLSPSTCNLANYKFDEKGYVINQYYRR